MPLRAKLQGGDETPKPHREFPCRTQGRKIDSDELAIDGSWQDDRPVANLLENNLVEVR